MTEEKTETETDVTKAWQATQNQKSSAKRLRIFAVIAWVIAIGGEIAGIVMLLKGFLKSIDTNGIRFHYFIIKLWESVVLLIECLGIQQSILHRRVLIY